MQNKKASHNEARSLQPVLTGTVAAMLMAGSAAHAQSAASAESTSLEEIIVTAEKSNRSLQNTATSIAVFSGEDLERTPGLDSTADIFNQVANMTTQGRTGTLPAVRGVDGTGAATGGNGAVAGVRARLAIQMDGRPLSQQESVYGANGLWDVQQVEVLRGPQSTLQGRNAIAGTVAIRTKDPTFDWEGGVRLIGGNYSDRQGSAVFSGPLIDDELAFRVSYDRNESDSFVKMPVPYPRVDNAEHYELETARAKLLWRPKSLDGFQTVLTLNQMNFLGPQSEAVKRPFDDHTANRGFSEIFDVRTTSAIVGSTWELNDRFTFENTLTYSDYKAERLGLAGQGNGRRDGYDMVVEPRVRFTSESGKLNALFGIYHYREHYTSTLNFSAFLGAGGALNPDDSTVDTAAFAQIDYKLSDRFELTLGARGEREDRDRDAGSAVYVVDFHETYNSFLPKLGAAWHVNEALTVGAVVSRAYNGGGAGFTFSPPFTDYTYEPEYAWNYETYFRARLSDRLQLTGNVFFADYSDYQLEFDLNPDPAIFSIAVDNGDVETYGAELGLRWLALPGLTLTADAAYLHTEIVDYVGTIVDGNELPRAPKVSGRFGASYVSPLGFDAGVNAKYSDRYYTSVYNPFNGLSDAHWLANAQAGYTFGGVRIFGSVENLFDTDSITAFTPGAVAATDIASIERPRSYRVGLQYNF